MIETGLQMRLVTALHARPRLTEKTQMLDKPAEMIFPNFMLEDGAM